MNLLAGTFKRSVFSREICRKSFVNAKHQNLLDALIAEAFYEVVQWVDGGRFGEASALLLANSI